MNPPPLRSRRRAEARPGDTGPAPSRPGTIRLELLPVPPADPGAADPPHRPLPDLLPDRLRACTFARLDPRRAPEAHRVCREYALNGEYEGYRSLFLFGRPGAGKSSLATAIRHQVIEQTQDPHHACFWPVGRGLRSIRQSLGQPPDQRLCITELFSYPLLLLDQVEEPASDWEAHQLYLLFETLWAEERRFVLTTDRGAQDLQQAFGHVQVQRLLRLCHLAWVGR